jgi:hypothetical protein
VTVTVDSIGVALELDLSETQTARAQQLINDVIAQAESIVSPLPPAADATVRACVCRHFLNKTGVTTEVLGPYSVSRPAMSGSLLSDAEIRALQRAAGRRGAFSVNLLPSTYRLDLPPWDADPTSTSNSSSSS